MGVLQTVISERGGSRTTHGGRIGRVFVGISLLALLASSPPSAGSALAQDRVVGESVVDEPGGRPPGEATALAEVREGKGLEEAGSEQSREPGPLMMPEDAPLVYLDCSRCDFSHVRQEIRFVNYLRDPSEAQIHVLVTDQRTGAGGRQYTLSFIGRRGFQGVEQTLTYASDPTSTAAEERNGLTETLKLGLAMYAARTPLADYLSVSFRAPGASGTSPINDSWNSWIFEIYGGGNFNSESTQSSASARYGVYADRVTEDWKIRLRPFFNHNSRTVRRQDGEELRVDQRRHGFDSYIIRSLGPHMGAGVFVEYSTSTVDNLRHEVTVTPAVEYSLYPYEDATRRQITFTYRAGVELADYFEETIYEQTAETLLNHSLSMSTQFRQPWGSISSRLTGLSYLHDASFHRLTFNGNVSFRLGGGVSLNIGGRYERVNDQLGLPRGAASLEDVLLQRRRLATAYRSSASIGLSYNFGSLFTNIVNPRL
jgi:hypothetical protein